jgi:hypothetical protein
MRLALPLDHSQAPWPAAAYTYLVFSTMCWNIYNLLVHFWWKLWLIFQHILTHVNIFQKQLEITNKLHTDFCSDECVRVCSKRKINWDARISIHGAQKAEKFRNRLIAQKAESVIFAAAMLCFQPIGLS